MEIKDKAGLANVVVDYLSCLGPEEIPSEELPVDDSFLDEKLLAISHQTTPWYADLVNYKVCGALPPGLSHQQRKKSTCERSLFSASSVKMGFKEDAC